MFDSQNLKSRSDHAVCCVEAGLHMIKAIKDVRHVTHVCILFTLQFIEYNYDAIIPMVDTGRFEHENWNTQWFGYVRCPR